MGEPDLDRVVALIYEAAMAPDQWPTALAALSVLIGAWTSHLFLWDGRENTMPFSATGGEIDPEMERLYGTYYGTIDPRRQLTQRQRVGQPMVCHHHFDQGYVAKSEFYSDFLIPFGGRFVMGTRLIDGENGTGVIGIHRSARQGPFEDSDLATMKRIVPHLMRAVQIQRKFALLRTREQTLEGALDRTPWGVVITDEKSKVLALNAFARAVTEESDGLCCGNGVLRASKLDDAKELERLIGEAARTAIGDGRHPGGSLSVTRSAGRAALRLLVAPHSAAGVPGAVGEKPSVIVFITDPEREIQSPPQVYARLFGLTKAEARLAAMLAEGRSLDACAEELGKAKNTLRAQLQSLFGKTGTRRQTDLLRLLARVPLLRPQD
jgi:DNA-binding CsgD family transcriptional regulator